MQKGCILSGQGFRIWLCPNRLGDCYTTGKHPNFCKFIIRRQASRLLLERLRLRKNVFSSSRKDYQH